MAGFDDQRPARGEPLRRLRDQRAVSLQPIAAAIKRQAWIVVAHLAAQARNIRRADIRRVRHDEIEPSRERLRVMAGNEAGPAAEPESNCVASRGPQRFQTEVGAYAEGVG